MLGITAVCLYVVHPDDCPPRGITSFKNPDNVRILGVSRRGTTDQWGLPGGKVEKNPYHMEDPLHAIIREVQEETGLVLDGNNLHPLYARPDGDFVVLTYYYSGDVFTSESKLNCISKYINQSSESFEGVPAKAAVQDLKRILSGDLFIGDAGSIGWIKWEDLIKGPFGKYNAGLKEALTNKDPYSTPSRNAYNKKLG